MKHITVLAGGTSNERAVSQRSGQAVGAALTAKGYSVTVLDPAQGLGHLGSPDAVFIALHGKSGEDGVVQQALEKRHIAYTGSDVAASRLCFDKSAYKALLHSHGIRVPASETVDATTLWQSPLVLRPFVLKPIAGGSSIDTFIIRDPAQVDRPALEQSLATYTTMLLEELIEGAEITVGILDKTPLPVIEIIPPDNGEFDYDNKYNGKTQELCPPAHVDQITQTKAQALALRIHELTGCRDLSRTDVISSAGELVVLETNTIPGLTVQSLYPKMAAAAGISMEDLADRLVQLALARA